MSIHQILFFVGELLGVAFVPLILIRKRHPVSALAWTLTSIFIPYLGVFLFLVFGASQVKTRLRRKLLHRSRFTYPWNTDPDQIDDTKVRPTWMGMDRLAIRAGATPSKEGNAIQIYHDGIRAFEEKFAAIRSAQHHIHLEYFILRSDETGHALIQLLSEKAAEGIQVRLLVDALGSLGASRLLRKLKDAGGQVTAFLPAKLLSSRFTFGLRNHRKILICDGQVGFVGGLNVGDEYLGKSPVYGHWRDIHMKLSGPAVPALQRVFIEDWDFASGELVTSDAYFQPPPPVGDARLQIVWSGPDQEYNTTHETYFAAITAARKRLWISTPYLIPGGALLMALRGAALRGVDVRILTQSYPPDHWIPYWAARYFWEELLTSGVRIFEYKNGMMHAKVMIADGEWASIGSANLDIRSIRLNFEVSCHIHTPKYVSELERTYEEDLSRSHEISLKKYLQRPLRVQLAENLSRLLSPIL